MNVEIETEATQFPEKEYINGIFVAVQAMTDPVKGHGESMPLQESFILSPRKRF